MDTGSVRTESSVSARKTRYWCESRCHKRRFLRNTLLKCYNFYMNKIRKIGIVIAGTTLVFFVLAWVYFFFLAGSSWDIFFLLVVAPLSSVSMLVGIIMFLVGVARDRKLRLIASIKAMSPSQTDSLTKHESTFSWSVISIAIIGCLVGLGCLIFIIHALSNTNWQ